MAYPAAVKIVEVGPRDGLQNETSFVKTADKIKFINLLSQTGLKNIEVTSFVSAKAIPQLADHDLVFQGIAKPADVNFSVLIPNSRGMLDALKLGVKHIAIFTAASETFNQRNIHCSIAESISRFIPIIELARQNKISVRGYISCALGCPYEGNITPAQVNQVVEKLLAIGVDEICLGDTIGVGTPKQTIALLNDLLTNLKIAQIALHFHDSYAQALANIYAAIEMGIYNFDSSVAGLGGCPYAQGATGNVATEDVLYLMHGLGIQTGIDIFKVVQAGDMICKLLGRRNGSKVAQALLGNGEGLCKPNKN